MEAAPNVSATIPALRGTASTSDPASEELALLQGYAARLRKSLRCACVVAMVAGNQHQSLYSIACSSKVRKAGRERVAASVHECLARGGLDLDAALFPGLALRVESPSSAETRVSVHALGVNAGREESVLQQMQRIEEDLRVRLENVRLSRTVAWRNSVLGELLNSVSGLTRRLSNIGDLLQSICDEARRLLRTDTAAVFLSQREEATGFELKAFSGVALGDTPGLNEFFLRMFGEYEISRKKLAEETGPGGARLLAVPLIQRGSPEGVLLFSTRDPAYSYPEDLLQIAELFSDWVSVVLENATMFERVSTSQQEWESTFDSIFDPIYLIDPDYRLKKINKALASYAMLPIKLPRNQNCYRYLFHRDSLCPWCPVPRSLRTGQAVVVEAPVFSGGIWQIQSYPFTDKSEARTGSINVLRDITLLKRIQEQLIESEKMASTGKLISGVAHEVRNPLFGISTTVRALANELGNKEDLKPFLDIVTSETARLNRLMEELLNYSRPVKIDKNPSDIGEIIREVIGRYANVPGGKEVGIHLFGGENIPPINIDRNKIHQVILNLVDNGIQHSGDNPRIDIFLEYLSLSYPPEIQLVIKDYGAGINPDILPRIFDPFFTTRSRGTGLGLSIVRKVVHDHGGRIAVESRPGVGTTFRISLPVHAVES